MCREVSSNIIIIFCYVTGWWFVSKDEQEEGWVPCGYLEPLNKENDEEENPISTLGEDK